MAKVRVLVLEDAGQPLGTEGVRRRRASTGGAEEANGSLKDLGKGWEPLVAWWFPALF